MQTSGHAGICKITKNNPVMLFDFISLDARLRLAIFSLERQTPWEASSSRELEAPLFTVAGKALRSGNRTHPKSSWSPEHMHTGGQKGDAQLQARFGGGGELSENHRIYKERTDLTLTESTAEDPWECSRPVNLFGSGNVSALKSAPSCQPGNELVGKTGRVGMETPRILVTKLLTGFAGDQRGESSRRNVWCDSGRPDRMEANTESYDTLNLHDWVEIINLLWVILFSPSSCLSASRGCQKSESEEIRKDFSSCFPTFIMSLKA